MKLDLISGLNESAQYRTKQAFARTSAREVCDFAFMDLIAIWILYNEYGYQEPAITYAAKTAQFNNFRAYRQMGTDLYLNLHVIDQRQAALLGHEEDDILLSKITLDEKLLVRYLKAAGRNSLTQSNARITLQRAEQMLYIQNSNYRSVRRMAQNWPTLNTGQKRMVLTRMIMFYQRNARRSEIFKLLSSLAKEQNLYDRSLSNPEAKKIPGAAKAAAVAGAGVAGYSLGSRFGDWVSK